jgi:hypothetical protein
MKHAASTRVAMHGGRVLRAALVAMALAPGCAVAGPPFRTDDPGVVDRGHFELLPFYSQTLAGNGRSGALPGLEVHYGMLPHVEIDLVVQAAFSTPSGASMQWGFGDTEIDLKYQFVQESDTSPAIGFVPNFILPTGNADRGLGNGGSQIFLPLWAMKTWDKFTLYGGGGYLINNGIGNRNDWYFGVVAQYQLSPQWSLGGELFHSTPPIVTQGSSTGVTLGAIYQIDSRSQLLLSIGKGVQDAAQTNRVSTYVGCLLGF